MNWKHGAQFVFVGLLALIEDTGAAQFEYSCTVRDAYLQERDGKLTPKSGFVGLQFAVSRESGKIHAPSIGPFFVSPLARQQILFSGGGGEPFTLISTNRTAEGGTNVEFLAIRDFKEFPAISFLAYGIGGMVFTGICK